MAKITALEIADSHGLDYAQGAVIECMLNYAAKQDVASLQRASDLIGHMMGKQLKKAEQSTPATLFEKAMSQA